MAAFPTLGRGVKVHEEAFERDLERDPTLSTPFVSGHTQTRAAFTRLRNRWRVQIDYLTKADRDLLAAHEDTQGVGSDSFAWTDADTSASKTVRYGGPIVFTALGSSYNHWRAEFVLAEV